MADGDEGRWGSGFGRCMDKQQLGGIRLLIEWPHILKAGTRSAMLPPFSMRFRMITPARSYVLETYGAACGVHSGLADVGILAGEAFDWMRHATCCDV